MLIFGKARVHDIRRTFQFLNKMRPFLIIVVFGQNKARIFYSFRFD